MTKAERQKLIEEIENIRFLSPNEPLTKYGVQRVLNEMSAITSQLEEYSGGRSLDLTLWDPNVSYNKGDIVVYFHQEDKQVSVEQGIREFVFILMSLASENTNPPNYDVVEHVPDFTKSKWKLLNPLSYLLQDLNQMRSVVAEVFSEMMQNHVEQEHGFIGSQNIENNLVRKDYSNLQTPWTNGKYSLLVSNENGKGIGWRWRRTKSSNGIMEYGITYGFEVKANNQDGEYQIKDKMYFLQKSSVWDESDHAIFSQKYVEDNMFSVALHQNSGQIFDNLRYGTNVFFKKIEFPEPFANSEYCVFFDTYGHGDFVFGYDKFDLENKESPTLDMVVSRPMLMNKTENGFVVVLPIHTHFNSMKKYNIGVPWKNEFRMQVIGRYK